MDQTLGMDPAQGMRADFELTGIIADDHRLGQQAVGLDAAPQGRLGGDQHRIGADLEFGNAKLIEMGMPSLLIGETVVGMFGQSGGHMGRERAFAHIGKRLGIDDVIAMAGPQQGEEVKAALRSGGAEPGEIRVADLGTEAVLGLVARATVT